MSTSAANTPKPHCIHAIGVGRTGAAYIEALIRTGEVLDFLATPGATFAALLIDIGDSDIQVPNDYARSFNTRLKSRGIAADRFHYESFALSVPDKAAFSRDLDAVSEHMKKSGAKDASANLPKDYSMPQAGQHVPRAIAKGIGGDERLLDLGDEHRTREVVTERTPVDVPLAGTGADVETAHRFFAAADGVNG